MMPRADEHPGGSQEIGSAAAAPSGKFGAVQSVGWAGTALPLTACVAIWGIGDSAPAEVAWLAFAHGVIGTAASA